MRPFLAALCLVFAVTGAATAVTPADISSALAKNLAHPYLYFTDAEEPAILARIETEPARRAQFDRMLAEANRLLYTPVTEPKPENRDSRFDLASDFLSVTGGYRSAAVTLAFVYQMTGEEKYAKKSFEFAKELCELRTWVMRAC